MLDLSQRTEALARRLAAEQDQSVDEIVRAALEERVKKAPKPSADTNGQAERRAALDRAVAAIAALPELDGGSSKAIMDDLAPL